MLTSLSLTLCLAVIAAPPGPPALLLAPESPAQTSSPTFGPPGVAAATAGYGMPVDEGLPSDLCPHCGCRHGGVPSPIGDWVCPRCDMSQRFPYWPQWHGNYYFRPYHMQRVIEQREIATGWGEDPRNPYGYLVFDRVYEQMRADEAAQGEPLPKSEGKPISPPPSALDPATEGNVTPKPLPRKDALDGLPEMPVPTPSIDRQGSNSSIKLKLTR